MVIDETVEFGGDRNNKVEFDPQSLSVRNVDYGDAVGFYQTDNGYKYTPSNISKSILYHLEEAKGSVKTKTVDPRIYDMQVNVSWTTWYEDDPDEYFDQDDPPYKGYLHIIFVNKGDYTIKNAYAIIRLPKEIKVDFIDWRHSLGYLIDLEKKDDILIFHLKSDLAPKSVFSSSHACIFDKATVKFKKGKQ